VMVVSADVRKMGPALPRAQWGIALV
jgi:hypothetical protein